MEKIYCIICSNKNAHHFITLNDRLNKTSQKYNLLQCRCGFIYLNPRPPSKEIHKYYRSLSYDPHTKLSNSMWKMFYRNVQQLTMRWKYSIIKQYYNKGSLLDIGGGKGEFAEFIHKKGWDVMMQDNITENYHRKQNISFSKELNNIPPVKKYNVITLWHSLEHIHNIKGLFNSIHKLLKESGTLIIAVPNMNAPERKFYKDNWAPYDAPRHLYHFNFDSLNKLCRQNGFDIIRKYSLFQDMPYNVLLSINSYSPLQISKAVFVMIYSFISTLFRGPKYSSSLLIICRKSI